MNITKEDIIKYFYGEKYLTKEIALIDFSKEDAFIISIGLIGSKNNLIKYKETQIVKKEKNVIRNMMKYFSKSPDFVEVENKFYEQDSIIYFNKNFLKHQVLEVNQIDDNTGLINCSLALKYSSIVDYWLHLDLQSFSKLRKCFNDEDVKIIKYMFESKERAKILRERRENAVNDLQQKLDHAKKKLYESMEFEAKIPLILNEIKNIIGEDIYNGFLLKYELGED